MSELVVSSPSFTMLEKQCRNLNILSSNNFFKSLATLFFYLKNLKILRKTRNQFHEVHKATTSIIIAGLFTCLILTLFQNANLCKNNHLIEDRSCNKSNNFFLSCSTNNNGFGNFQHLMDSNNQTACKYSFETDCDHLVNCCTTNCSKSCGNRGKKKSKKRGPSNKSKNTRPNQKNTSQKNKSRSEGDIKRDGGDEDGSEGNDHFEKGNYPSRDGNYSGDGEHSGNEEQSLNDTRVTDAAGSNSSFDVHQSDPNQKILSPEWIETIKKQYDYKRNIPFISNFNKCESREIRETRKKLKKFQKMNEGSKFIRFELRKALMKFRKDSNNLQRRTLMQASPQPTPSTPPANPFRNCVILPLRTVQAQQIATIVYDIQPTATTTRSSMATTLTSIKQTTSKSLVKLSNTKSSAKTSTSVVQDLTKTPFLRTSSSTSSNVSCSPTVGSSTSQGWVTKAELLRSGSKRSNLQHTTQTYTPSPSGVYVVTSIDNTFLSTVTSSTSSYPWFKQKRKRNRRKGRKH